MPRKVTMCNVLYVPKLTCNLFSVRATVTMGNTVKFENDSWRIYDRNGLLLGTGSLFDKLYYLKYESITQEYVSVGTRSVVKNKADLWHQQLGHLNENQLREMASQDFVKDSQICKDILL